MKLVKFIEYYSQFSRRTPLTPKQIQKQKEDEEKLILQIRVSEEEEDNV